MTKILVDDHADVDALFLGLTDAFGRGDSREILVKLDYVWARLAMHIRAEHLHLFPALLAAVEGPPPPGAPTAGQVQASVERLREDHDFFMRQLAEAVNGARTLAAEGGPADAGLLRSVRDIVLAVAGRLAEHNRVEEEQVYIWPGVLLGEEALEGLRERMRREIENLPPRFFEGKPQS